MADSKSNPWWDNDEEPSGEGTAPDEGEGNKEGGEGQDDFVSHTPPTMQAPGVGQAPSGGTEPTVVGAGFSPTPPTISIQPGAAPQMPQSFTPFGQTPGTPAPGTGSSFVPTPPTMGAFGAPAPTGDYPPPTGVFPQTAPMPAIPGTAPGMTPTSTATGYPSGTEEMTEYQQLQLGELGAGVPYATQGGNMGLLLDVPVPLTVVLGRSVLRIQEVLGLQPGSVVPLDHNAEEPVDLLIKDKLIAQGEVVVIDGNFGIKITKIVEPEQRVRDLG